jgi:hypothetical protein
MTQGECLSFLRDIHEQWAPTNVSPDKLAFLAAARLIEVQPGPVPAARLTELGSHCKVAVRPVEPKRHAGSRASSAHHQKRRNGPAPKPLV